MAEMVEAQSILEEKAVADWGGQTWSNAVAPVRTGDLAYRRDQFPDAISAYKAAILDFEVLQARSSSAGAEALKKGQAAFDAGDAETATKQFEIVLKIDPSSVAAQQGLARSKTLNQVLGFLSSGKTHEEDGRLDFAQIDYREAVRIDPQTTLAVESLKRIEQKITDRKFQRSMSAGISAFRAGKLDEAKTTLLEAKAFQPENKELNEALAMVEEGLRRRRLEKIKSEGIALETAEKWQAALDHYNQALAIDKNMSFANAGAARAVEVISLEQNLDRFLLSPEKLQAKTGLANAQLVSLEAGKISYAGPKLASKIQRFNQLIQTQSTPVGVQFASDEKTQVVIYRVGRLGTFASKSVNLRPGTYVVTGNRPGYRDVRLEIMVEAGKPLQTIRVSCTEKI